jgi:glycosyltransferase involved in cell wall biosynthesis
MLKGALESLIQQSLDKALYEIIVADNGSTDDTSKVVRGLQTRHKECNIVLIHEPRQGLGHARNAAFRYARGNYVAFMDDDARADKDWLKVALHCFEHVKPTPLGVGGPIFPLYEFPKPAWFKDEYEIRTWGDKPRFLNKGESFSGSNMVFRKEILRIYGGFDVRVGVRGKYISVGEETSLFEKIWQCSSDTRVLYYSPQLLMFHVVSNYKMTISYQLKRAFAVGQAWYIQHGPKVFWERVSLLTRIPISITRHSGLALLHTREYPTYQNWVVERFTPIMIEIGRLIGCLGFFIPVRQR